MNKTNIPWADLTWNPITGCTKGCDYCYARAIARRFTKPAGREVERILSSEAKYASAAEANAAMPPFPGGFAPTIYPHRLDEPLRLKKPSVIFLGSMGDLFDPAFPDKYRDRIFSTVAATPQHTYMLLTKLAEEMQRYFKVRRIGLEMAKEYGDAHGPSPLPNLWLGVTVTNQADADERIPLLLGTPAVNRFVSVEPMLGPVDLTDYVWERDSRDYGISGARPGLDSVIVGAKTPGKALHEDNIRCFKRFIHSAIPVCPAHQCRGGVVRCSPNCEEYDIFASEAVRSLRDECVEAGVPFHYKHGKHNPELDGVVYDWRPEEGSCFDKLAPENQPMYNEDRDEHGGTS